MVVAFAGVVVWLFASDGVVGCVEFVVLWVWLIVLELSYTLAFMVWVLLFAWFCVC